MGELDIMRLLKKIVSTVLALALIFCTLPSGTIFSLKTNAADSGSNYLLYQAEKYSESFTSIFGDESDSFANIYYTNLENDADFKASLYAWETLHIVAEPSYAVELGLITKKELYTLALFDLFDATNSDSLGSSLFEVFTNEKNGYIYSMAAKLTDTGDLKINELKSTAVTAELVNDLKACAEYSKMFNALEVSTDIISLAESVYDAVNLFAGYEALSNIKSGVLDILLAIHNDTSNDMYLRAAAYDCITYFDTSFNSALGLTSVITESFGTKLMGKVIDGAWDKFVSSSTIGAIVVGGIKGMRVLTNACYDMDESVRTYYKLGVAVKVENSLRRIMNNASLYFQSSSSSENAAAYMNAVDAYKRAVLMGYDYSVDLLEVQLASPANLWFDWLTGNYSECVNLINEIERLKLTKTELYADFEAMVLRWYVDSGYSDYHSLLQGFENQSTVSPESATLTQIADINIGDSGRISDYIKITLSPTGAEDSEYRFFSSSNEGIITVSYGSFEALNAGTCTLYYDKGGELEASITVTVGSEPTVSEPYDYSADFEYYFSSVTDGIVISKYNGNVKKVIIPYYLDGYKVTSIGNRAFMSNALEAIIIPSSVTNIAQWAFVGCNYLESITLPSNITNIGLDAFFLTGFYNNDSNWENNALYIGEYLISCKETETNAYTIKSGTKNVAGGAFQYASSITSITIPNSVTNLSNYAFSNSNITNIVIPDSVTNIGKNAFRECYALVSATLPNSIITISGGMFEDCKKLKSITIPNSVTSIDGNAFKNCTNLSSIIVSDNITSIVQQAFANTAYYNDTSNWQDNVLYIDKYLIQCKENKKGYCKIKDGTKVIANFAFAYCDQLTSIIIPESVTNIGYGAFAWCDRLTSITIPKNVTSIDDVAFSYCDYLKSIILHDNITSLGTNIVSTDSTKIYCQFGSETAKALAQTENTYYFFGDFSNNKALGAEDLVLMKKAILGNLGYSLDTILADVNRDDKFNLLDAVRLKKLVASTK